MLAIIALCYSGLVSFTSMGISMFFGQRDLLRVGHAIVLVVFLGGGLGFVAWTKQYFGHPLVNVACSLASLGCITILIKEGAVQAGAFSDDRVVQVLLMVIMGVIATTAVNVLILPVTARSSLVKDLEKNTDLLGEMLISITRAFLSGRESDMTDEYYKKLASEHQASLTSMSKNLGEAKREHLVLGNERLFAAEERLVECLTGLAQDLGGLRSAAFAQFAFMNEDISAAGSRETSPIRRPSKQLPGNLDVIAEAPEESVEIADGGLSNGDPHSPSMPMTPDRRLSLEAPTVVKTPADMFVAFLAQLGPPTKSLVFTLKQILDELRFERQIDSPWRRLPWIGPKVGVVVNENFHSSLERAIELYRRSRKDALSDLYASRAMTAAAAVQQGGKPSALGGQRPSMNGTSGASPRSPSSFSVTERPAQSEEVIADIEEVSACCGHFSFSVLDFAEDILTYLDILYELKDAIEHRRRTWTWMVPWRRTRDRDARDKHTIRRTGTFQDGDEGHDAAYQIPSHVQRADDFADPEKRERPWTYKVYRLLRIFRRDDVRFAIKVGFGALLYALPAFLASTRPFFVRWRGEWGLVSYMAVCSMTVGASNTTSINRFIGKF